MLVAIEAEPSRPSRQFLAPHRGAWWAMLANPDGRPGRSRRVLFPLVAGLSLLSACDSDPAIPLRATHIRAMCLIEQGRFDDAIAVMRPFVRAHQYYPALAKAEKTEEAREVRDRALQFWAQRREGASDLAEISLGLGDTTEALNGSRMRSTPILLRERSWVPRSPRCAGTRASAS